MSGRVVHVDVLGQKYAVRSELDPAYIAEIANYLDQKMQLAAGNSHGTDHLRVAVIAALNITDEVFARAQRPKDGNSACSIVPRTSSGLVDTRWETRPNPPRESRDNRTATRQSGHSGSWLWVIAVGQRPLRHRTGVLAHWLIASLAQ
jgi:cell division protein ZapA (FtsZ GTPase activity inhibitor)